MRFMIVDDHKYILATTKILMESISPGYVVDTANSMESAVALLLTHSYDFVFVDLNLGHRDDGESLMFHIKARAPLTRLVVLSADESPETILRTLNLGAVGYISKVSQGDESLADAIRTVLDGKIYLPQHALRSSMQSISRPTETPNITLSKRLSEVLFYLCQGLPNKAIANTIGISENTVRKVYVTELFQLFGVKRRTELIVEVARRQQRIIAPQIVHTLDPSP